MKFNQVGKPVLLAAKSCLRISPVRNVTSRFRLRRTLASGQRDAAKLEDVVMKTREFVVRDKIVVQGK